MKSNDVTSNYIRNNRLDCPIQYKEFDQYACESLKYKTLYINKYLTNDLHIIDSIVTIGDYFNPSIMPMNNQFIMINRNEPHLLISNDSLNSFKTFDYKITKDFISFDVDYRMVDVNNGSDNTKGYILLVYTYENTRVYPVRLYFNESKSKEKNWTPFQYYNDIYFIRQLNPLDVMRITDKPLFKSHFVYKDFDSYEVTTVSTSYCHDIPWNYGELRGGTQALHIRNYGYLSFFHSIVQSCLHNRYYFFGAYIYSNHPPFKLLKISNQPIISNELFIDFNHGRFNWSIVFPMSYFIEDDNGNPIRGNKITTKPNKIVLSVGYNDSKALLIKLNFDNLIDSMINLKC